MTAYPAARRTIPADATRSMFPLPDGWPMRVFDRPAQGTRGSILWIGGRGDIIEKYLECLEEWHGAGWHVTAFDWRGQGGSGRLLADPSVGHMPDFATWIDDLAAFWADWTARTPGPHVVMGHSMGGHLVLRAVLERRIDPAATVLSAPMLGFSGGLPTWLAAPLASVLARFIPETKAWKQGEKPGAVDARRQFYLTHDAGRYADEVWWKTQDPSLELGPASWAWVAAAYRSNALIDAPGALERLTSEILVVGTEGDRLVSPAAIRRAAARLSKPELLMFDKSVAHEVLREIDSVRNGILGRIAAFLDRAAPAR
ncbi:alpha/beta fold hydrolase [Sphingomonas sp. SUN039]|uniref:alpha/beta fold hydrolase n=1 Tax=Sphingomonas sp. SUN039 TaxID=2937787 RepID=UPI0021640021|nr:alpha/beta hydrolase [Sphingomonas sp. SUN039]UVO53353.1 alpha/beta hydrolase [Sphingomonas sp. SUN039]